MKASLFKSSLLLLVLGTAALFNKVSGQLIMGHTGNGVAGYSNDGVPGGASSAMLGAVAGIVFDASNNMYIVDSDNHRIRRVDAITGTITSVAGTGSLGYNGDGIPATTARLNYPRGIAIDKNGDLYIGDNYNYRIRKINMTTGIITTVAGNGINATSGNGGLATAASISRPRAIDVDPSGNLYISQTDSYIRKVSATTGIITNYAGTGIPGSTGDGGPATAAQIYSPMEIKCDAVGNLFLTDNNAIRKINSSGIINRLTGTYGVSGYSGDGGLATSATVRVWNPYGMTLDAYGNLFFCDKLNNVIRKITSGGIISTVAGDHTSYPTITCQPALLTALPDVEYIAFDYNGNMYMSSAYYRVFTMSTSGVKIADVDINTLCSPGYSTPPVAPQFTVTCSGGVPPYTYLWTPASGNTATLNSTTSRNPQVTSASGLSNFVLTVTDNSGCGTSVTRNVQATFHHPMTPDYDLSMRDSYFDMHEEPNNQETVTGEWNIWQSQDVWNRLSTDGIVANQMPCSGCNNYMYTTVRNVGCAATPPANLFLYWTLGGLGETWPGDWTTNTFGTSSLPKGLFIGPSPTPLPSLNPGDKIKVSKQWTPPNPSDYYPGATSMDVCFLARIVDGHNTLVPGGMTYAEVAAVSANVRKNNNIVTRNTSVVYIGKYSPKPRHIIVGNTGPISNSFSLQLMNENASKSTLSQFASATLDLGSTLFDRWVQAGAHGTYSSIDYNNKTITFDGVNTLQLDSIVFDSLEQFDVQLTFQVYQWVDGTQMQEETVHFRQLSYENQIQEVYGNFTFTLMYDEDPGAWQEEQFKMATTGNGATALSEEIKVFPNPTSNKLNFEFPSDENVSITLTDVMGRVIASEHIKNSGRASFNVGGVSPGIYLYEVNTSKNVYKGKVCVE